MRIYDCAYINIIESNKNVNISDECVNIDEFVEATINFIEFYIDNTWIPQTNFRMYEDNSSSVLLEICKNLCRSKYLYLNKDRTEGILIHVAEYKIETVDV